MHLKSQYQTLFAYTWSTTERLLALAALLSEADYKANPGYGHGSIHDLFFHLLRSNTTWRKSLESGQQQTGLQPGDYPDLLSLHAGLAQEKQAWMALLEAFDEAEIGAVRSLTNWRGVTYHLPLWRVLQHLVLHGMQHNTELAQLLTAKGHSPGNIDFIFFEG